MAFLQRENEKNRAAEASGNTHRCEGARGSSTHTHTPAMPTGQSGPAFPLTTSTTFQRTPPSHTPHRAQIRQNRQQQQMGRQGEESIAPSQPDTLPRFVHPPHNFHSAHCAVKRPGEKKKETKRSSRKKKHPRRRRGTELAMATERGAAAA